MPSRGNAGASAGNEVGGGGGGGGGGGTSPSRRSGTAMNGTSSGSGSGATDGGAGAGAGGGHGVAGAGAARSPGRKAAGAPHARPNAMPMPAHNGTSGGDGDAGHGQGRGGAAEEGEGGDDDTSRLLSHPGAVIDTHANPHHGAVGRHSWLLLLVVLGLTVVAVADLSMGGAVAGADGAYSIATAAPHASASASASAAIESSLPGAGAGAGAEGALSNDDGGDSGGGGAAAAAAVGNNDEFGHPRGGDVAVHVSSPDGGGEAGRPAVLPPARTAAAAARVWSYGWITAVSTGLGALPLLLLSKVDSFYLGVCNAMAGGMMAAASVGLLMEGMQETGTRDLWLHTPAWARLCAGLAIGVGFMTATKGFLERHEHLKFAGLGGVDARKMLLIVAVMTLHSFSEGIGIGVSFGSDIGVFISTTLAIHNVPEGLAVCLVLVPRRVHLLDASLWAVLTSLPQPLMAVPAFWFVQQFMAVLPLGLGFAAGAMLWVAVFDLWAEAKAECGARVAAATSLASAALMAAAQMALK